MSAKASPKIPPKKSEKPAKDTVYVDVEDEITTIIDKVEGAKEKIVALVLPKRAGVLQSTVNMRLLKRAADKASKSVVLITNDAALLPLAGVVGLHTAKNLQSKPEIPKPPTGHGSTKEADGEELEAIADKHSTKLDYHRSIGELAAVHAVLDDEAINLEDEAESGADKKPDKGVPKDKKLKIPDFDRFRLKMLAIAGAGVLLLVFLIMAIFVLPKATITVKTTSVPVSADFDLTTSDTATALDEAAKVIPASIRTKDQTVSQSVQATGQQNNGKKAKGSVKLSIACAAVSGSAPKVPAGTGVTANGLTFITQETATLDNPEFSPTCRFTDTVDVTAQQPGAKYNIGPASFAVQGYSSISGTSSSAMSGGTDEIVTIVSQSDIDKVKQQITAENSDKFAQDFQNQLAKEGLYVISATLKLSDPQVTATPGAGQPASSSNVTVKVNYSVMAVKKDDLEKVVTSELNKSLDKSKQKLSTDDVLSGISISVKDQKSPAVATLEISQTSTAVPILDQLGLKKQIAGQKTSTIKALLADVAGVEDVQVKLSPFWVSKAPKNTGKIIVIQQESKSDQTNETP